MDGFYQVITCISTICAIVFGFAAFKRNDKADTKQEATQDATVLTEIGYIKSGIDDIKTEQRDQRKTNTDFLERLSKVEASAKQAHHRIDTIEKTAQSGGN